MHAAQAAGTSMCINEQAGSVRAHWGTAQQHLCVHSMRKHSTCNHVTHLLDHCVVVLIVRQALHAGLRAARHAWDAAGAACKLHTHLRDQLHMHSRPALSCKHRHNVHIATRAWRLMGNIAFMGRVLCRHQQFVIFLWVPRTDMPGVPDMQAQRLTCRVAWLCMWLCCVHRYIRTPLPLPHP